MPDRYFLDTDILIYAYSNSEPHKADIANSMLFEGESIISSQVINEFSNICLKKLKLKENAVIGAIHEITSVTHVVGFSLATQLRALQLCEVHCFSYYDALIASTALENHCPILYSEDMQNNQLIDNQLRIVNPF
ncbi:PIN domain-containing protein [Methylomonas rosea]|uniref:PIN domain-containing protein n=1 Tax=Methylomonas rosea TaxID=2952227 RepID=A0ABT1TPA3_9GAMM|nr:PIN domain-containing protein [Methylomonas sp. WSC-7]MCQ8116586.1 PIN domain-containing protein [Methylomonas sp. WSC-7]